MTCAPPHPAVRGHPHPAAPSGPHKHLQSCTEPPRKGARSPEKAEPAAAPRATAGPIHHSPSSRQRRMCTAPVGNRPGTSPSTSGTRLGPWGFPDQPSRPPVSGLPWGTARCWCGHMDTGTPLGASKHGQFKERCSPRVLRVLQALQPPSRGCPHARSRLSRVQKSQIGSRKVGDVPAAPHTWH